MKKRRKRNRKPDQRYVSLGISGLVLIVLGIILAVGFRGNSAELTGSSIIIHKGVSNYFMNDKMETIQTLVYLEQPTLNNIGEIQGGLEERLRMAREIIEATDPIDDFGTLYRLNPPFLFHVATFGAVEEGAQIIIDNFQEDTHCLKRIGENYGGWREFKMFLVSELKYQKCKKDSSQLFAYAKHTFFNGNKFLCSQESDRLFLVEQGTGRTNADVNGC